MLEILSSLPTLAFFSLIAGMVLIQSLLTVYLLASLRTANKERSEVHREIFGLMKKIEGLTATRRETMLRQYDKILENLAKRLPPTIAAQAGQRIFETESKILSRLSEIEPTHLQSEETKKKIEDLIRTMENLEHTIVVLTSDTVQKVMVDARRDLFEDEQFSDISLAA